MSTPAREYAAVLMLGVVSAGLAVTATTGGRPWGEATVESTGMPPRTFVVDGPAAAAGTGALALVALAGLGAVLATVGPWRRAVGVLVAVAGAGVLAQALLAGAGIDADVREDAADTSASADQRAVDEAIEQGDTGAWRWAAAAGGAGTAGAGVLTVLHAGRWPTIGRRYEAPVTTAGASRDETDLWRSLDRGDDPTT